jgi:hypothetical protein
MWVRLVLKVLLETRVRKVQQDLKVQLEQLAQSDQQGRRVSKVFRVLLDLLDPKGRLVLLGHKVRLDQQGQLVQPLPCPDPLDQLGLLVALRLSSISNTMSPSLGTL